MFVRGASSLARSKRSSIRSLIDRARRTTISSCGDLFGAHDRVVEQVLGVPLDDRQRRTQLVTRQCDEVVAAAVHLLEHRDLLALAVQHGLTLLGELVPLGDVGGDPVEEQPVALASRRTPRPGPAHDSVVPHQSFLHLGRLAGQHGGREGGVRLRVVRVTQPLAEGQRVEAGVDVLADHPRGVGTEVGQGDLPVREDLHGPEQVVDPRQRAAELVLCGGELLCERLGTPPLGFQLFLQLGLAPFHRSRAPGPPGQVPPLSERAKPHEDRRLASAPRLPSGATKH